MSKQVELAVKIKNANEQTLQATIRNMEEYINAQVSNANSFTIWNGNKIDVKGTLMKIPGCSYNVDVYIKDGELKINGDEMDLHNAQNKIQNFYKGTYMQQQIPNAQMEYNSDKRKIRLTANMGVSY